MGDQHMRAEDRVITLTYGISVKEQHRSSQDGLEHFVVQILRRINKHVEYQQRSCNAEKDGSYS